MKLRIRGNSLRLRLTKREVAALIAHGEIAERIEFGIGNALDYRLGMSETATECHAVLGDGGIVVFVPASVATHWANSDSVSIQAAQPLSDNRALTILIEKDYACLVDRPGEDDSDAFPHPKDC
ncbi:MAG: hypothetical protein HKN35_12070 [Woeseia sp.]|nr:hypothetical protein [Woeseia sp.]MBT8096272.1 hypothetical protein [Woeseia sp.]NNE61626.1 hypothetical protein [Woeseia sp.]NNL55338.1 hypothetical protein [Woeseia sp.]